MYKQCLRFSFLSVLAAVMTVTCLAAQMRPPTRTPSRPGAPSSPTPSPRVAAMEPRIRTLEDREAIRQLLIDYGRTLDRRDFEAFSKLFSEDAEYVGGTGTAIKSPAAIAKSLEDTLKKNPTGVRSPNFHLFANEVIQVTGDEASATSKGIFVVPSASNVPQIEMIASYEDTFVREESGWKFKKRVVHADLTSAPTKK